MDEEALAAVIQAAQGGDPAAYDVLVEQYGGRVFGFLFRLTGSRHDAEDLMQDVFLRVVRTLARYDHDGRFEAWIFRIAANLVRDRVRRAKRTPRTFDLGDGGDFGAASAGTDGWAGLGGAAESVDAPLVRGEEVAELNQALDRLPPGEREVILLRHFSQMSFKEIAELMGTPLGTALARAHRGLARLRALMTDSAAEPQGPPVASRGPRS